MTTCSVSVQGVGTLFLGLIAYKFISDPRETSTVKGAIKIPEQKQALTMKDDDSG